MHTPTGTQATHTHNKDGRRVDWACGFPTKSSIFWPPKGSSWPWYTFGHWMPAMSSVPILVFPWQEMKGSSWMACRSHFRISRAMRGTGAGPAL